MLPEFRAFPDFAYCRTILNAQEMPFTECTSPPLTAGQGDTNALSRLEKGAFEVMLNLTNRARDVKAAGCHSLWLGYVHKGGNP